MRRPFRRRRGDRVLVSLSIQEADLLTGLPADLRRLLADPDPGETRSGVHRRLFPRAYLDPTEEEAEAEWQRLMHEDLLAQKLQTLDVLEAALTRAERGRDVTVELDAEESAAWLGALNDLRLALGTILEVTEELDLSTVAPDDPRASGYHVYGWLTWLQGELIEALGS